MASAWGQAWGSAWGDAWGEVEAGDTPTPLGPGDRTTLWAKYMDTNGHGNDRYRAAINSTGDLTTDASAHLNQG